MFCPLAPFFFLFFFPPRCRLENKLEREAERVRGSKEKNGKKVEKEEKTGGRLQVRRSVAGVQL